MDDPSQTSKPRIGRPPWQPTEEQRKQVEALAGVGLPHKMIARLLGISDNTLREHLDDELKIGEAKATAKVAQTLFSKAVAGDTASLIFWMKARANWSEKYQMEHSGPDGTPLQLGINVNFVDPPKPAGD